MNELINRSIHLSVFLCPFFHTSLYDVCVCVRVRACVCVCACVCTHSRLHPSVKCNFIHTCSYRNIIIIKNIALPSWTLLAYACKIEILDTLVSLTFPLNIETVPPLDALRRQMSSTPIPI